MERMIKYDHKKNVGNKADVWKHEVLLRVIALLKPETYFETHCGFPYYNLGKIYLSSYMKVRLACRCSMTLCDIEQSIAHYIPIDMDMNFINVDGWSQIQNERGCDFYFVDPPYLTMFDLIMLVALLEDDTFTKPLVAWYPIFKDTNLSNYDFGLPKWEYKFKEGELAGCGMVFKNFPNNIQSCVWD